MTFKIGDYVEIVGEKTFFRGERGIIIAVGVHGKSIRGPFVGNLLSPRFQRPDNGREIVWRDILLKKIDPPDWEAPKIEEKELSTS